MEHQKTIEIFVCCEVGQVVDWLNLVAGPVVLTGTVGAMIIHETCVGTVFVTPGVGDGSFVSIYLGATGAPWATDVDFARQAAAELGCVVRCDPGQHHPDVHPESDIFLEIDRGAEVLVDWYVELDS